MLRFQLTKHFLYHNLHIRHGATEAIILQNYTGRCVFIVVIGV